MHLDMYTHSADPCCSVLPDAQFAAFSFDHALEVLHVCRRADKTAVTRCKFSISSNKILSSQQILQITTASLSNLDQQPSCLTPSQLSLPASPRCHLQTSKQRTRTTCLSSVIQLGQVLPRPSPANTFAAPKPTPKASSPSLSPTAKRFSTTISLHT
jgi:hypothetical protein